MYEASSTSTPHVIEMQVIPVAGHDSMLLNLCGAHAPYFTRNLVLLRDNAGRVGCGEVPGGEGIRQALERCRELVLGQPVGRYNRVLNRLRQAIAGPGKGPQTTQHQVTSESEARVLKQPHEINLRLDNVITAVEAALLDLLGQHLDVPVAELLGSGQQRDRVPMLAYLFYIGERQRTDLPYLSGQGSSDDWYHLRHQAALTPEAVAQWMAHTLDAEQGRVSRWYLPGSHSLNFLLENALGGGGVASLRIDPQGKAFAQQLLEFPVPVPRALAEAL